MAGITAEIAEERLTAYLNAEAAVLAGQSHEMNGRKLTLANLKEIQEGIAIWQQRCVSLGRSSIQVVEVIPR